MCNAINRSETGEWVCIRARHMGDDNHYFTKIEPVTTGDILIALSNVFFIVAMLMLMIGLFIAWFDIMPEWEGIFRDLAK